jgi:hypothetical protein
MRARERTRRPDGRETEEPRTESPPAPAADLLRLQASAGNAAVVRLLRDAAVAEAPAAGGAAQLEADWNNPVYARSRDRFAGGDRPKGEPKERYLALAPLYKVKGIDRPLKWAHENITSVTFFGSTTPAHVDLKRALEAAEADLRKQGMTKKPFESCWAFNPRTTSKGGWSNHADGKAIDIDASTNPHFTDLRQKKVINALTGMDITAENLGADMGKSTYEALAEMSKRFQDRFTPEGMEARIAELEADEARLAAEEADIKAQIKALPKPKRGRLTDEERKTAAEVTRQSKELTKALAAKHGQVAKAQERQDLLAEERARFEKVDTAANVQRWKIAELITEIYGIEKEIDKLEAQIEAAEADLRDHLDDDDVAPGLLTRDAKKLRAEADKAARAKIRKDRLQVAKLKKGIRTKHQAIAAAEEKIDSLHRWGSEGFMDLEPQLVTALKKAGLSWGGEWAGSKDLMHFEVPAG